MNNKYYKRDDPNKQDHTGDDSMIIKAYVPPMLHARLRDQSRLLGLPMSRLVAIAIDNELDQEQPFHYSTDLPENAGDYAYVTESDKLLTYICRYPNGIGRDHLCLARHEFGINDRSVVLAALKSLLVSEMVEEVIPTKTKFKFWISSYRLIRAKDIHRKERKPRKFRRVEGKSTHYAKNIKDKDVEK